MYEEYYGFIEKPFSLTPDPKYLFKSESHANAFELLQYAIRRREGIIVVTGDIGTGKTTLCRALLEQIDRNAFTALVLNPFLSEQDLLEVILQDFGVVTREQVKAGILAGVSKQALIDKLYDFLLGLLQGSSAVLIIDEAQNLPGPVLEQIRILSNLETDKEKLLQIFLVGQPNLRGVLQAPEMRQLDQRVSIRCELKPLSRGEVAAYVSHRLAIADGASSVSFSPQALRALHRQSGGIPRLINLICDRALVAGFSAHTNKISAEMIARGVESLELRRSKPSPLAHAVRKTALWFASVALTALALTLGAALIRGGSSAASPEIAPAPVSPAATPPADPAPPAPSAIPVAAPEPAPAAASEPPPAVVNASQQYVVPASAKFGVLVASFPIGSETAEAHAVGRISAVTAELETLGYPVYHADVDLGARGRWRRVIVGAYETVIEGRHDESRLRAVRVYRDARLIAVAPAG